jgi:hypothetical protein
MMSRSTRLALLAITGLVVSVVSSLTTAAAEPDGAQATLTAVSGTGSGLVLIAPTAEDQGTFAVEVTVNVHDALPNMAYIVSRAVDLNPDGVCTLASGWLTNGPLNTSSAGAGAAHFEVHRGAPFVSGVRFDAEFRVLGADGNELRSECVTVTVK